MLSFEEFFKKKKIALDQLERADPKLYSEFQSHYSQMGEKSFDHTKKNWFNNLRRTYHLVDEPKVEKVKMENHIAEQTVIESVTEKVQPPKPKVGFTPKFKAAIKPDNATELIDGENQKKSFSDIISVTPVDETDSKASIGTNEHPKVNSETATNVNSIERPIDNSITEVPPVLPRKLGFKPKFKSAENAATLQNKGKPEENASAKNDETSIDNTLSDSQREPGEQSDLTTSSPAIAEQVVSNALPLTNDEKQVDRTKGDPANPVEKRAAYKPRFQMKNIKGKTEGDD